MCSNKRSKWLGTVRARLTCWYAGLFFVFSFLLFVTVDSFLRSQLRTRMDDALTDDVREFETLYEEYGLQALAEEFRREASIAGVEDVVLILRSPNLKLLVSSDIGLWQEVSLSDPELKQLPAGVARFRTLRLPGTRYRARFAESRTDDGNILQVGMSLTDDEGLLRAYRRVFAAGVLAMLLFGVGVGRLLTGRAMAGVEQVTRTARGIGEADLSVRVPSTDGGREIEELVEAFNGMLDRIRRLVSEIKRVTDDIAHDLRSPLTRIRGLMEPIASRVDEPAASREAAGAVVEECDRLTQMINTMLEITATSAGVAGLTMQPVDLAAVVADAHELFLPVAEDKALHLELSVVAADLTVRGDLRKLQRAVANLIDNAIKYTLSSGRVEISLERTDDRVVLTVADTGVGIAEDELPRVFERFYRADTSRATDGNGLGLPLTQAIVRAHEGEITVESGPGTGSRFSVVLPAANTARDAG